MSVSTDARSGGVSLLVDARGIDASGIGRYLREVLTGILGDPRFARVTLAGDPERLREFVRQVAGIVPVEFSAFDYPFYSPVAQLSWPGLLRSKAGYLTFLPHYDGPLVGLSAHSVVTVQDLIHFKVPELFPLPKRAAAGFMLSRVCSQAGRVLVTSSATERDLHERLPFTRSKTQVIPLGVGEFFQMDDGELAQPRPLPTSGRFILCIGNRKPHKNHVAAVELLARLTPLDAELKLVVAGRAFEGAEEVMERALALGVADRVIEVAAPGDAELRALYAGCSLLLFPSLYEGFGLPLLEAMGCGAPVVASNRSSIPEVAGGAAVLVDPFDYDAMAEAAAKILTDGQFRSRLVAAGRTRAAMLTWEKTSSSVADLLVSEWSGEPARRTLVSSSAVASSAAGG